MRFLIRFSYDGSAFFGFQTQPHLRTIQGVLESAAQKINRGIKTNVVATGRTDKGVHALSQYAHVDFEVNLEPFQVKRAMNRHLPNDVHVIEAFSVAPDFHARFLTKEKTYQYHINTGEYNPLRRHYCYQHNYPLDIKAMEEAMQYFLGTHDFRAFVTENKDKESCVRTIEEVSLKEDAYYQGEYIITFRGTGFLRYQVRNMVGALLKVGTGKIEKEEVKRILDRGIRGKNGATAPAEGLYLTEVVLKDVFF